MNVRRNSIGVKNPFARDVVDVIGCLILGVLGMSFGRRMLFDVMSWDIIGLIGFVVCFVVNGKLKLCLFMIFGRDMCLGLMLLLFVVLLLVLML